MYVPLSGLGLRTFLHSSAFVLDYCSVLGGGAVAPLPSFPFPLAQAFTRIGYVHRFMFGSPSGRATATTCVRRGLRHPYLVHLLYIMNDAKFYIINKVGECKPDA